MDDPSLSSTKVDKDTDSILDTHDSDRGTGQWKLSGDHGICNPVITIADEQELDNSRGDDVSSTQYDSESGSTPHAKDISSGNTANNDSTNIWAKQSMDADKGPDTSVQKLSISIVSDTIVEADTMDKYASQTFEDAVRQRTSTAPDGQVSSNAAVSVIDTSHTSDSFSGDTDNATADMDIKCDLNVEHSSETVDVSDNFRGMRHNREEEDDEYSESGNKKLKKDNESDHSSSETIKNMHTSITGLGDPMPDRQDGVKEDNLSSCSVGSHPPIDDTPSGDPTLKSDTDYDSPTDNPPPPPPLPSCPSPPPPFSSLPPSELPSLPPPPIFYISSDTEEKPPLDPADPCVIEMNILQKTEAPNVAPPLTERCDSQLSTMSEKMDICRICHCEGEENNKLISPCLCSGSLKYIHLACLQKWIKSSDKKSCELCNFDYIMTMKTRPFKQWERLEMTSAERRKIVCSVTFHIIAITCVIWSLYVLIDRTTEEVHSGTLDWPFWTKLIVVAIGFTGGLVFMYVQCKMYVQLCLRWRQFNKLINIENAPEDADLRAEAAARIKARSGEQGGVVNTIALQDVDSL